jgi:hypothetical protein
VTACFLITASLSISSKAQPNLPVPWHRCGIYSQAQSTGPRKGTSAIFLANTVQPLARRYHDSLVVNLTISSLDPLNDS